MSNQDLDLLLVWLAAPAQTAFVVGFGLSTRWWKSLLGRALFTKALALALLLDLTVFADQFGYDYPHREEITTGVLCLVVVGSWMQLFAFGVEKARRRLHGGQDRFSQYEATTKTLP